MSVVLIVKRESQYKIYCYVTGQSGKNVVNCISGTRNKHRSWDAMHVGNAVCCILPWPSVFCWHCP